MDAVPALRVENLSKRFSTTLAVDDLSLTVPPGEVFGFLGPNGAGKSTTIRLLLGLLRPTEGAARIFDDPVEDVERAHRHLAYVPADVALWPALTGQECLDLLAGVGPGTDRAYRNELVARFRLELDRRARTYSTGNRQKVALVAAFSTRAPLLILDEPTSGLDPLMDASSGGASRRPRNAGRPCSSARTSWSRWKRSARVSASSGPVGWWRSPGWRTCGACDARRCSST